MFITSNINPRSASDGHLPVAIFYYEGEKRFIGISDSYEETIEKVMNGFRIQSSQSVLLQTSSFTACQGSPVVIDSSAYPSLWPLLEKVEVVLVTESVLENVEAPVVDADKHEPVKAQQLAGDIPSVAGPSRDGLGAQIPDVRRVPTPTPINASEDVLLKEEMTSVAARVDPLFQWEDENQQGEERGEHVEEAPFTPQPKLKVKAAPTSSIKPGPDVTMNKKEKQKETDIKLALFPSMDNLSKKTNRSLIEDDSRFDVAIIGPDEETQFKLRGKNSVRKVLLAACKNFDLDPNRAYLVHSLELEVDGEIQTHNFVCAPDDTMAMCGITSDSKLFVKVNPDTEDDPADDSSD